MSVLTDTFRLANGSQIPQVGFGTWQIPGGDTAYNAVANALKAGYRHIDTAKAYANESSVGKAIRDSGIPREEIFVTTKLPAEVKTYQGALDAFDTTMANLDVGYVDLYLIHAPWPWGEIGKDCDAGNLDVWRAMEKIYASGKAKAIGVSNFNSHDLQNVLNHAEVAPMVDQIQYYVGYTEPKITKFAQDHDMLVEAYSPLATGDMLTNEAIKEMANKYHVSAAQLALRFVLENGVLPLPKATSQAHITANAQLDFSIAASDMAKLNAMSDTAKNHEHNGTQG